MFTSNEEDREEAEEVEGANGGIQRGTGGSEGEKISGCIDRRWNMNDESRQESR